MTERPAMTAAQAALQLVIDVQLLNGLVRNHEIAGFPSPYSHSVPTTYWIYRDEVARLERLLTLKTAT